MTHHDHPGAVTQRAGATAAPLAVVTGRQAAATSPTPVTAAGRIRRAVLVPRYDGDATSDWYPWLGRHLDDLGIRSTVVPLLPERTAPAVDQTVAAIAHAVGDDPDLCPHTLLIGHSVGSRALLAYLDRREAEAPFAGLVSVAGWFTVDDLDAFPVLVPWVELELDRAGLAAKAGPITVHLSDNDLFTANWADNAAEWLSPLGASVHVTSGAGHFMAPTAPPVLDTVRAAARTSAATSIE